MGDLNRRTKLGDDFVMDNSDKHSPINMPFYIKDTYMNRENMDNHPIDEQGKLILGLCQSSSLRILNGRSVGDKYGKLWRFPSKPGDEPSCIDYALCSVPLIESVKSFSVLPFTGLSDHCCISLKFKTNIDIKKLSTMNKKVDKVQVNKYRFTYDKSRKLVYQQALRDDKNVEKLNTLLEETKISNEDIDKGIHQMNEILLNAAKKACLAKKVKGEKRQKNPENSRLVY